MKRHHIFSLLTVLTLSLVIGCAAFKTGESIPKQHEEKLTSAPDCLECHDAKDTIGNKPFSAYVHNESFFERHKSLASGGEAVCESCHKTKFCSDCHDAKEEIVPSRKLGNRPDRASPHRGDYLTKHRLEGHIDQSECFKCHGRRNNDTCKRCHNL